MALQTARGAFAYDMAAIAKLGRGASKPTHDDVRAAARQFEALFLQQMLTAMRKTVGHSEAMGSESAGSKLYQEMLDAQWSQNLSRRGMGLADMLERQLGRYAQPAEAAAPETPAPVDLGIPRAAPRALAPSQPASSLPQQSTEAASAGTPAAAPSLPELRARALVLQALQPLADLDANAEPLIALDPLQTPDPLGALSPLAPLSSGSAAPALPAGGLPITRPHGFDVLPRLNRSALTPGAFPMQRAPASMHPHANGLARPLQRPMPAPAPMAPADGGPVSARPHVLDFVQRMHAPAVAAARQTGVPVRLILAQAALETGWGKREITTTEGEQSFNVFGIKATGWRGPSTVTATHEYEDGALRPTQAGFRVYDSYHDAFADWAKLIGTAPRYAAVRQADSAEEAARALQKSGYATDPDYADKLIAIMRSLPGAVEETTVASARRPRLAATSANARRPYS